MSRTEKMKNIAARISALNAEADNATSAIEEFNKSMQTAGLGIEVWLDDPFLDERDTWTEDATRNSDETEVPVNATYCLGYAKVGNEWQLAVDFQINAKNVDGEDWFDDLKRREKTALRKAERNIRCLAYLQLDDLIEKIEKQVTELTLKLKQS